MRNQMIFMDFMMSIHIPQHSGGQNPSSPHNPDLLSGGYCLLCCSWRSCDEQSLEEKERNDAS